MRPARNNSNPPPPPPPPPPPFDAGFVHWRSPAPYLFCGVALLMGLIAFALIILVCSYKTSSLDHHDESSSRRGGRGCGDGDGDGDGAPHQRQQKPPTKKESMEEEEDEESKIVVIMAGDNNPTYLAKPVHVSCACNNGQQAS